MNVINITKLHILYPKYDCLTVHITRSSGLLKLIHASFEVLNINIIAER